MKNMKERKLKVIIIIIVIINTVLHLCFPLWTGSCLPMACQVLPLPHCLISAIPALLSFPTQFSSLHLLLDCHYFFCDNFTPTDNLGFLIFITGIFYTCALFMLSRGIFFQILLPTLALLLTTADPSYLKWCTFLISWSCTIINFIYS